MDYFSKIKKIYNEINGATLSGAIDVIVVKHLDGEFTCSPFHVRFGKLGVLRSREKVVDIEINGNPVDIRMKLGETGEAFFVEGIDSDVDEDTYELTSPLPSCVNLYNESDNNIVFDRSYNKDKSSDSKSCDIPQKTPQYSPQVPCSSQSYKPDDGGYNVEDNRCPSESIAIPKTRDGAKHTHARSKSVSDSPVDVHCSRPDNDGSRSRKLRKKRKTSQVKRGTSEQSSPNKYDGHSSENSTTSEVPHKNPNFTISDNFSFDSGGHSLSMPQLPQFNDSSFQRRNGISPNSHPFSDTDLSPTNSPNQSRSSTPIKSDSEYELSKQKEEIESSNNTQMPTWEWGELPNTMNPSTQPSSPEEHRSMLQNMFSFMRSTKNARREPESGAIYLEDLSSSVDPEISNLYFYHIRRENELKLASNEEDLESGNGTSVPHSPHSHDVLGENKIQSDSDFEDGPKGYLDDRMNISFSMCGNLQDYVEEEMPASVFSQCLVSYDDFCQNPAVINDDNLVVKINGKYYNWATAAPQIMCHVLYQRSLPNKVLDKIKSENMPKKEVPRKRAESRGFQWFSWRRQTADDSVSVTNKRENDQEPFIVSSSAPSLSSSQMENMKRLSEERSKQIDLKNSESAIEVGKVEVKDVTIENKDAAVENKENEIEIKDKIETKDNKTETKNDKIEAKDDKTETRDNNTETKDNLSETKDNKAETKDNKSETKDNKSETKDNKAETDDNKTETKDNKTENIETTTESGDKKCENEDASEIGVVDDKMDPEKSEDANNNEPINYKKSLRLSADQIRKLKLKYGANEAIFSVTTAYQGTTRCRCNIYLWNHDEKIVISDIDGTITKSDVLGHILPILGSSWSQSGITQLYTKINNNGYNFLYLSSRAIGQASSTRGYLKSVKQDDLCLPDGPILLNPTSLIIAFHKEVIIKKPEEFKMACLRDIRALFKGRNPFYAGYGNRINDVWAYYDVGVPNSRIFTINPKGELKLELSKDFQSTYQNQTELVHYVFPSKNEVEENEDYTSLKYWKIPLPSIENELGDAI